RRDQGGAAPGGDLLRGAGGEPGVRGRQPGPRGGRGQVSASPAIGMVGLGEAGTAIAIDLVSAGATVRSWDPVAPCPEGVEAATDAADAAAGTDLVVSANSAGVALEVARSVAP